MLHPGHHRSWEPRVSLMPLLAHVSECTLVQHLLVVASWLMLCACCILFAASPAQREVVPFIDIGV